jgi:hypothetical protein
VTKSDFAIPLRQSEYSGLYFTSTLKTRLLPLFFGAIPRISGIAVSRRENEVQYAAIDMFKATIFSVILGIAQDHLAIGRY